jgi:DNA invertase Pin-like site-specific DNA recombinase
MKRQVCAYCRVSTLSEEQQLSFSSQKLYFEQYCIDKGYELYKIYADEGISGTSTRHREGLLELLSECGVTIDSNGLFKVTKANPPFNLILISNTSRLGRNLEDVRAIVRCLRQNNVYIHFLDSGINTEDTSSDFMLNLLQLFDEQFSNDLSSKVKNGFIKSAVTTNKIHTNSRLYGYRMEGDKLVAIPNEASTIKLIFDLYEQGYGLRRISNELEAKGITNREGKRFCKNSLLKIITQSKYCGINNRLRYKKSNISSTLAVNREGAEQYYKHSNDIEVIISEEQFNKCQEILASKQGDRKGVNRGNSPYATKIRCGICNASYTSNVDKGRRFYNCSNKAKYGLSACNNRNISLNKLNSLLSSEWLVSSLEAIKLQQKTYIKRSINKLEASKDIDNIKQVEALKIELTELEDKKSKLLDLYLDGIVDKLHYTEKLHSLEAKITRISAMIEEYSRDNNSIDEVIKSKKNLICKINQLKVEPYYCREEIIDYIHSIIVEGNTLTISLNIQGEVLELPEQITF